MSERVAKAATELLRKLDVDVRTGERVTEVDADGVHTATGTFFPADLDRMGGRHHGAGRACAISTVSK